MSVVFCKLISEQRLSWVGNGHCNPLIVFVSVSMSATVTLFENRHHQIQHNDFRLSNTKVRFGIQAFNYIYSILFPLPVLLNTPDQLTAKQAFLTVVPCPYEDFFTLPLYTFTTDPLFLTYCVFAMMAALLITVTQIVFYSSTCLYYLVFSKYNGSSKITTDSQKRFFLGILVQVCIPYLLLSPANIYASWSILSGYYSQSYSYQLTLK